LVLADALLTDSNQCCNATNSVVPFFLTKDLFVGATSLVLQQQLFDNISGDIKGFVFQHNSEVYKFISAAVDLFD
jgi:hypothetical protein